MYTRTHTHRQTVCQFKGYGAHASLLSAHNGWVMDNFREKYPPMDMV